VAQELCQRDSTKYIAVFKQENIVLWIKNINKYIACQKSLSLYFMVQKLQIGYLSYNVTGEKS
jgi:hypothetical protein